MKAAMTGRLELKPEVEASLAAQAGARGVGLDAYLQGVIEDLARPEVARPYRDPSVSSVSPRFSTSTLVPPSPARNSRSECPVSHNARATG